MSSCQRAPRLTQLSVTVRLQVGYSAGLVRPGVCWTIWLPPGCCAPERAAVPVAERELVAPMPLPMVPARGGVMPVPVPLPGVPAPMPVPAPVAPGREVVELVPGVLPGRVAVVPAGGIVVRGDVVRVPELPPGMVVVVPVVDWPGMVPPVVLPPVVLPEDGGIVCWPPGAWVPVPPCC